mmetsp:Transcript_1963/g.5485  ORF Transcript_1963/g.5485 Transcript_1963/m.5485 type:complete len:204 (-) Transcript_1963:142-753(-)
MPTVHPGASRTAISCAPRSSSTCCAVVGDTWPKRLADGAATGTLALAKSSHATAWSGQRTPTKPVPALTARGSEGAARATMVRGPGQKAVARCSTAAREASSSAKRSPHWRGEGTWTMRGSVRGRPFTRKMSSTASSLNALAPRPYTVSVGKATRRPSRRSAPAAVMPEGLGLKTRARGTAPVTGPAPDVMARTAPVHAATSK